jgi:hypothetical protein
MRSAFISRQCGRIFSGNSLVNFGDQIMRCFFTFALAVALAAGISATSWSQTGGGAAGAGGAGAGAGGAGAGGGATAGATGNAAATAGQAGTATNVGAGATNTGGLGAGAIGRAGGNVNGQLTPGTNGNTKYQPTTNGAATGPAGNRSGRVNGQGPNGATNTVNGRLNANGLNANNGNNGNAAFQNQSINQTPFFTDPGVRQQLNLNGTQYNSLNQGYQNAYTRYQQGLNNLNTANLSPQQREMQQQQLEAQFNQDLSGSVNSTISNPQMQSRFNQLNRQYQGFNAFNDPSVRQQLNLSQDQIRQLRTLSGNWRQQLQQLRQNGQNTADPAAWQQLQQQYATQLNGVLTPAQQRMWSQQTGKAYSFSPDAYYGGQQSGSVEAGTQQTVDPTVPKYFPSGSAQPATQSTPATTQPNTTPSTPPLGTPPQGSATGANPGGSATGANPGGSPTGANPGGSATGSASATQGSTAR